jgi:hypothetical protein
MIICFHVEHYVAFVVFVCWLRADFVFRQILCCSRSLKLGFVLFWVLEVPCTCFASWCHRVSDIIVFALRVLVDCNSFHMHVAPASHGNAT